MHGSNQSSNKLNAQGRAVQASTTILRRLSPERKKLALQAIAQELLASQHSILEANDKDCRKADSKHLTQAEKDRLKLTPERLNIIAKDVTTIAELPDPIGEIIEERTLTNGLNVQRIRVPIGVIGIIYESRPNVTVDIASLCLKSGNSVLMRGGKEALYSNQALVDAIHTAVEQVGITKQFLQFVDCNDRSIVQDIIKMNDYIDLIIPRGGTHLIQFVKEHATIPAITGGIGVCHTYVDKDADIEKAASIVFNAKVSNPSVCNALDTILIHREVATNALPQIANALLKASVELRCDPDSLRILQSLDLNCSPALESDWGNEFLSLIASVKIVDSLEQALAHISKFGSGHSEAIVTENQFAKQKFLSEVDAAAVFSNTSTRFTDGSALGLGSEVAISTNKLHARGPMGIKELTTYKWVIQGEGQIRT